MRIAEQVQHVAEQTPGWVNWMVIFGSWLVSFLQPLALLVTVIWGGLQIYLAVEKRWFRKKQ